MKESIIIRKLGPISNLEIPEIKQLTVLIGKSSTGKSAVMKTIAMMRYIFKRENIKSYLKNSNIKKSPIRTSIKNISKLGSLLTSNTEIIYKVTIESTEYTLTCKNLKIEVSPKAISKKDLTFIKGSYISESRSFIPSMIEKIVSNRNVKLGFYEDETLKDFDESTNVEIRKIGFMNMDVKVKKSPSKGKQFFIENKDQSFDLKDSSSGIRNVVPVEAITEYFASEDFSFKEAFNRSVLQYLLDSENLEFFQPVKSVNDLRKVIQIHIEEPEISLDPISQTGIIRDLVSTTFNKHCADRMFSTILTTHSPYILNYLNVLIERYNKNPNDEIGLDPDKIAAYRIEDGTATNIVTKDEELDNRIVIDTAWFSDSMEKIYSEYEDLVTNQINQ